MKGENDKLNKIKKGSNTALIITKITKILCIAAAAACVATGVLLLAFHDRVNEELAKAELSGNFSKEELLQTTYYDLGIPIDWLDWLIEQSGVAEALSIYIIVAGVEIIILAVIMHFVGKIFTEIRDEDSPFRQTVLKNLRVPFVLITLVILRSSLLIGAVAGLALYCVYEVFEYGAELQRLSDETL